MNNTKKTIMVYIIPACSFALLPLFSLLDKSSIGDSLSPVNMLDVLEEVLPSGGDGGGLKQIGAYPA